MVIVEPAGAFPEKAIRSPLTSSDLCRVSSTGPVVVASYMQVAPWLPSTMAMSPLMAGQTLTTWSVGYGGSGALVEVSLCRCTTVSRPSLRL